MRDMNSSPGMFKDFLEGSIWKDIKGELAELREDARDAMEGTDNDEERRQFSYRARTVKEILFMIEGFAEEIKEEIIEDEDLDEPINPEGDENE